MKIGLKLYVNNDAYLDPALNLFSEGYFDYIEVYLNFGKSKQNIQKWVDLGIPIAFHAPHSYGGFNPSLPEKLNENRIIMQEVVEVCSLYKPLYLVFHPGINGDIHESIIQYNYFFKLYPHLLDFGLIENKPFLGMNNEYCIGSTPEEISLICNNTGMKFCLDFGHAICAAASLKLDWKEYIEKFMKLRPLAFHLSDGHIKSEYDEHLHFSEGDYDLHFLMRKIINDLPVAIETEKHFSNSLDDFLADVKYLRAINI